MMKVVAVAVLLASTSAVQVTPVQKVIELLNGMVDKGTKEKQDEQVQFATFKGFCDNTVSQKQKAIADASEEMESLKADIEKSAAEAERLSKEIAAHDADISTWEGDLDAAVKVRQIENTDYTATHKDYTETITALEGAIGVLKKQSADTKQAAAALAQVTTSKLFPVESRKVVEAFLQTSEDATHALSAPEANAYEFQSQGIVDMLTKLADKFDDERTALEKEETSSRQSFEMLSADIKQQLNTATSARTEKSEAKAKALQGKANSEGALQDTTTTQEDDEKYAADLTATCEQKSTDFAERQLLRAEEIEAIKKAIEILSSGAVSGASEKHIGTSLVQTSLAQFRSEANSPNQARVAVFLKREASRINSRVLSVLAMRVEADPFKRVKKMIKDLIVKLMEEANEEAEQKGFCDKELATNKHTRKEKSEAVVMLHSEIDELTASVASLTESLAELTKAVAEIDEAVAKATAEREAEKAKNQVTIKDAQGAQVAVAQALSVLNEFYAKAGGAAFMQMPEAPSSEPYKGMGGAAGGVVGMIEVIQTDFARLESETSAAESEGAKQYDEFMNDSEVDKVQKTSDIDHKSESKQDQSQALTAKKGELDGTQKELDAALAYYEKLKPSCVDSGDSFEDRVARRKEEIESLKTALRILNGEDIA